MKILESAILYERPISWKDTSANTIFYSYIAPDTAAMYYSTCAFGTSVVPVTDRISTAIIKPVVVPE
jgi:hypothetical protein